MLGAYFLRIDLELSFQWVLVMIYRVVDTAVQIGFLPLLAYNRFHYSQSV